MFARAFTLAAAALLGLSLTACSALTQPEEITIAAEPLPSPNAPPPPAAPPGMDGIQPPGMPARPAGGG